MRRLTVATSSVFLCVVLLIGSAWCYAFRTPYAEASVVRTEEVDDNFDAEQIGSAWSLGEDARHLNKEAVLRFHSAKDWNQSVNLQRVELSAPCTITFNVSFVSGNAWLGVVFGIKSMNGEMAASDAMIVLEAGRTAFYSRMGDTIAEDVTQTEDIENGMHIARTGGTATIRLELTDDVDSPEEGDCKVALSYRNAAEETVGFTFVKEYGEIDAAPFFGFASMNNAADYILDITDFKMVSGEEILFEDDFSAGSISYANAIDDNANWRVSGGFGYGADKIFCGRLKTVGFGEKENAVILSNYSLRAVPESKRAFVMKYDMFVTEAAADTLFGVGFGLSDTRETLDRNVSVGVLRRENDYAIVKSENGSVTVGRSLSAGAVEMGERTAVPVLIEGYYDRKVTVSVAGLSAAFEDVSFDGSFGIGVTGGDRANALEVDNFYLETYSFASSDAPDQAINFQGVRSWEELGDTLYEPYLNEDIWLKSGNGVKLGDYGDNCINFTSARENVLFGPKRQQYSDVIIRFDVRAAAVGQSVGDYCGIGITIGREYSMAPYQEGVSVFLTPVGGRTQIRGVNAVTETGEGILPSSGSNLWKDTKTWYNVLFIVSDNCISLYYKEAGEPVSELGKLRARFVGVNTHGYAAIACATADNKANHFSVTNVSFTNLEV